MGGQPMNAAPIVSMVKDAYATETQDVRADNFIAAVRNGRWRDYVEEIRREPDKERANKLKTRRPGVLFSGKFAERKNDALIQHSGLLCADLDKLNGELQSARGKLVSSPYLWGLFISPSGEGIKAVFRVPAEVATHKQSHRAAERHVRELTGIQIDETCKDPARLCFVSSDPNAYHNPEAQELKPLSEPQKPKPVYMDGALRSDMLLRERIASELLGSLSWSAEKSGYFCKCPGETHHTNGTGEKHTIVYLDGAPTVKCQHNSCSKTVADYNDLLRSRIGKAECAPEANTAVAPNGKPRVELPCDGRLLSQFASDIGEQRKRSGLYRRGDLPFILNQQRDGLELVTPQMVRTLAENHLVCYRTRRAGENEITPDRTMSEADARGVLCAQHFLSRLPQLERVATTRLPVMRADGNVELLPIGYDPG